jgi:D-arabinose 1-dehydrogenase-like Zn-dependent alcohol dehydrogenase
MFGTRLAALSDGKAKIDLRECACGVCSSDLHFHRGEFPSMSAVIPRYSPELDGSLRR